MSAQPGALTASRIAVFNDGAVAEIVLDASQAAWCRWYSATGGQADNWALNGSWSAWYGIGSEVIDISISAASPMPSSANVAYASLVTADGQRAVLKLVPGGQPSGMNL